MRALIDRPSRGYVLLPLAAPRTAGRSWSHHGPPAGELPWLSPDGGRGIQRMTYELHRTVPSEATTGEQRRLGSIIKTGSMHARRLLTEAA